jgi:hypothetical protein
VNIEGFDIATTGYDEEVEEEDVLLCRKCKPNHLAHPMQETDHHLVAIVSISLLLPSSTPMKLEATKFSSPTHVPHQQRSILCSTELQHDHPLIMILT